VKVWLEHVFFQKYICFYIALLINKKYNLILSFIINFSLLTKKNLFNHLLPCSEIKQIRQTP